MERMVRAILDGEDAAPGRLPAADFAKLVLGLQAALRRAAHVVLGRPRQAITGRYEAVIEEATRLRFVGIERGSFVGVLALPEVVAEADVLDVDIAFQDLGYRAFQRLLDAVDDPAPNTDPALARAIAQLAEDVNVGGRTDRVLLEMATDGGGSVRSSTIDETTRQRMHEIAHQAQHRSNVLHGRLMEADFEKNRARLRLPDGSHEIVLFNDDLADEIQGALRELNTFIANVRYHGGSGVVAGVDLRAILPPTGQLELRGPVHPTLYSP